MIGHQVINFLQNNFVIWSPEAPVVELTGEELKENLKGSITREGLSAEVYLSRPPNEHDPITGHLQWMKGHNSTAGIKIEVINAGLNWGKAPELLYFITGQARNMASCITLGFMFHF